MRCPARGGPGLEGAAAGAEQVPGAGDPAGVQAPRDAQAMLLLLGSSWTQVAGAFKSDSGGLPGAGGKAGTAGFAGAGWLPFLNPLFDCRGMMYWLSSTDSGSGQEPSSILLRTLLSAPLNRASSQWGHMEIELFVQEGRSAELGKQRDGCGVGGRAWDCRSCICHGVARNKSSF